MHFPERAARFHIDEDTPQAVDVLGNLPHFAQAVIDRFELFVDLLETFTDALV